MFEDAIWDKRGRDELSQSAYGRGIAICTIAVACIVAMFAAMSFDWQIRGWAYLGFALATFAGSIVGILIFTRSDQPVVSFLGVALMCACLGLLLGPFTAMYSEAAILDAILITAGIMVVMSILGLIVPRFFLGIGPFLMAGLVFLIVAGFGQIILALLGFEGLVQATLPWTDWIGIAIFTLFVGFDWARAMKLPYTWDNAIDASGGLVLDAVNIFIRVLARRGSD